LSTIKEKKKRLLFHSQTPLNSSFLFGSNLDLRFRLAFRLLALALCLFQLALLKGSDLWILGFAMNQISNPVVGHFVPAAGLHSSVRVVGHCYTAVLLLTTIRDWGSLVVQLFHIVLRIVLILL
jgi:hypothetical protein